MDLINDFICHCPLGKHQVLGTCLQKYHAINFLYIVPGEHSQCVHRIHLHTDLFVSFSSFKKKNVCSRYASNYSKDKNYVTLVFWKFECWLGLELENFHILFYLFNFKVKINIRGPVNKTKLFLSC